LNVFVQFSQNTFKPGTVCERVRRRNRRKIIPPRMMRVREKPKRKALSLSEWIRKSRMKLGIPSIMVRIKRTRIKVALYRDGFFLIFSRT
jgi:hypothetical protein